MATHQHDPNANELWLYFQSVTNAVFPKYRKEMQGIEWGFLYNEFKDQKLDSKKLEEEISRLMEDEEVGSKKGIYTYCINQERKIFEYSLF